MERTPIRYIVDGKVCTGKEFANAQLIELTSFDQCVTRVVKIRDEKDRVKEIVNELITLKEFLELGG